MSTNNFTVFENYNKKMIMVNEPELELKEKYKYFITNNCKNLINEIHNILQTNHDVVFFGYEHFDDGIIELRAKYYFTFNSNITCLTYFNNVNIENSEKFFIKKIEYNFYSLILSYLNKNFEKMSNVKNEYKNAVDDGMMSTIFVYYKNSQYQINQYHLIGIKDYLKEKNRKINENTISLYDFLLLLDKY